MSAPETARGFESPSLGGGEPRRKPAFELKFLIDEAQAQRVEDWARLLLSADPHGRPELDGAYRTTSLYFDTPELDVYRRSPSYKRRKFRARRYGYTSWVYLERKWKAGDRVSKRRVVVPEGDMVRLAEAPVEAPPEANDPQALHAWPGAWFHQRITARRLRPACRMAYSRTAYAGLCPEGPMRVTLDRDIRGILCDQWRLEPFEGGASLLPGKVILEFKFLDAVPLPFKKAMEELRLTPTKVSKYRLCREAWGARSATAHSESIGIHRGEVSSA